MNRQPVKKPRYSPAGICGCSARESSTAARVPSGEVDIVARRGRTLAFVKVKARGTEDAAALALDHWRLRRHVRIDAWFIVPQRWLRHLANVWQG